jgi:Flp pilus assembly protein TadD
MAGLGRSYLLEGKFPQAVVYLKRAVTLQPDSANFHYQLAQAYLKLGERAAAQAEFAEQQKLQVEARDKQTERISGRLPAPAGPAP